LCTGNTCRSPVAEVLARDRFGDLGLTFVSAGLDARRDLPAAKESRAWALERGLDLRRHRSRAIDLDTLSDAAWVIGMTRSHAALFRGRFGHAYAGAIGFLGAPGVDLSDGRPSPVAPEVPDPYGSGPGAYDAVCSLIEDLLEMWRPVFVAEIGDKE
jgi:protein-tyrosine phosphatase